MDGIAKTSLLTAAMRAVETNRTEAQGRLFVDPYADLLSGFEGHELLKKAIAAAGDQPAVVIRTAYIDQKIQEAIKSGVKQLVFLAAGMDTRAYRLHFPSDITVYELDRKEVLDYKKDKLKQAKPTCELKRISVDLRDEWVSVLKENGFDKSLMTLWLVEGLLMYLHEKDVLSLFAQVNSIAQKNDIILFDILSQTLLEVPHMKNQLEFLSSIGATWYFGLNDPKAFMLKLGWHAELSQAADFAPSRWPFPSVPLDIPNVPRGYYVKAIKI